MSTKTPATPSWSCSGRCSAAGTRSPRSVTRASPSTAGAARARATCAGSPRTSRWWPGCGRSGPRRPPAPPRCWSCRPASGTPRASLTRPRWCRRNCATRRPTCPGWSPRRIAAVGARSPARCWTRSPTRPNGWPGGSSACWPSAPAALPTDTPGPKSRTRARPACGPPTSRCCAASGPSSWRYGRPSRPAASQSRWWAWAGCWWCPRCRTWWPRCGCCTTRARRTRWPGC